MPFQGRNSIVIFSYVCEIKCIKNIMILPFKLSEEWYKLWFIWISYCLQYHINKCCFTWKWTNVYYNLGCNRLIHTLYLRGMKIILLIYITCALYWFVWIIDRTNCQRKSQLYDIILVLFPFSCKFWKSSLYNRRKNERVSCYYLFQEELCLVPPSIKQT